MYGLAKVDDITYKQIEDQRNIWLDALFSLPEIVSDPQNARFLEAALLERATSGLIIDSFLVDVESSVAQSLTNGTREQMRKLMDKLSSSNK